MKRSFDFSVTLLKAMTLVSLGLTSACSQSSQQAGTVAADSTQSNSLRELSKDESVSDLRQLSDLFKVYYGPLEYKQKRFGFSLEQYTLEMEEKIKNAKSEEEAVGYLYQFAAKFDDGHVGVRVSNTANGISYYSLPFTVAPVENSALVTKLETEKYADIAGEISVGDELLSVDGVKPTDILPVAAKYKGMGNALSVKHFIMYAVKRPSFITELKPTSSMAKLEFKRRDGSIYKLSLPWTKKAYNPKLAEVIQPGDLNLTATTAQELNEFTQGTINEMGATKPFFLTPQVQGRYGLVEVYASESARARVGLAATDKPAVYSALYKYKGKSVLLVRVPTYAPADYSAEKYLKYYKALMTEFEPLVDLMVVDQTHNPGGNGYYCSSLASMFSSKTKNAPIQKNNTDRKWINRFKALQLPEGISSIGEQTVYAWGFEIEKAYDAGQRLSVGLPIFTGEEDLKPFESYQWSKPRLVLIDELAGSCGDVFPMLMRDNQASKLFGQRTMGLGGSVEEFGNLNNSQISVRLTRGLFMTYEPSGNYDEAKFVENNGVTPDYEYNHTMDDTRNGFIKYVEEFSNKAIEQVSIYQTADAEIAQKIEEEDASKVK